MNLLSEMNLSGETHSVKTEDGYLLKVHRIPRIGATPVLMVHGFLATSAIWLLMPRKFNIATILANEGYDVWLVNQRGNVYSHSHILLSSDSTNYHYWNFSAYEIGSRDLPATIDYILTTTKRDKVLYIGHSMGTTLFFILCSVQPDYCAKVSLAVLLAPIAYPSRFIKDNIVRLSVSLAPIVAETLQRVGTYEILGRKQTLTKYIYSNCPSQGFLCDSVLTSLGFPPSSPLLKRPVVDYFDAVVGGTSVKTYQHMSYIQSPNGMFGPLGSRNGRTSKNSSRNGEYKIDVSVPVALFWSTDDLYIDDQSIKQLIRKLKNIVFTQVINKPFSHTGYIYNLKNNYSIVKNILNLFSIYS